MSDSSLSTPPTFPHWPLFAARQVRVQIPMLPHSVLVSVWPGGLQGGSVEMQQQTPTRVPQPASTGPVWTTRCGGHSPGLYHPPPALGASSALLP